MIVNVAAAAIDSAVDGQGITRVTSYQVEVDVAAGRLVLLLETYGPPAFRYTLSCRRIAR